MLLVSGLCLVALTFGYIAYATALPRHFPRNIPVVPLWPHFWDVMCGASKSDLYNRRIRGLVEKHGIVCLWQEGWWTILVTKPEYLVKVFKNSDRTVKKKGLAERIPWGSGAKLFGINIIDSDDDLYSYFRKLLLPGFAIQPPIASMKAESKQLAEELLQTQNSGAPGTGVLVGPPVWRWALSVWGDWFMDTRFPPLEYSLYNIQQVLKVQNAKWLGRLKGLFPVLDRLPWKWPVTAHSDKLLHQVEVALLSVIEERGKSPPPQGSENKVGFLLYQARQQNMISDFHYKCNLRQLFIAGHENVENVLNSAMEELAKHPHVQDLMHSEIVRLLPADYTAKDLDQLPLLNGVIYEALRLYPPLGHMTNRLPTVPFQLDSDIVIPPGVMIGWHAYGVQTDPQVWGEDAMSFNPWRWGTDAASVRQSFRTRQARGQCLPFGIYSRRCLGYTVSLQLLQCTLVELVRLVRWEHPQGYQFSFGKAALVVPDNITVVVRKREDIADRETKQPDGVAL